MLTPYRLEEFVDPKKPALAMASKNFPVCKETSSIRKALKMMIVNRSRRVAVVNSKNEFIGLVKDIDVLGYLGGDSRYNDYVTSRTDKTYGKGKRRTTYGIDSSVKKIMRTDVGILNKNQSIRQALNMFKKTGHDALPVLDKNRKLLGILSKRNIVEALYVKALKNQKKKRGMMIKHIMVKPMIVKGNFPTNEVAKMMCMGGFRRFPVTEHGIMTGIVTTHDLLYFLNVNRSFETLKTEKKPIKKIASTGVVSAEPETDVADAIKVMLAKKIGALPIADEDELKGIVTFTDIIDIIK